MRYFIYTLVIVTTAACFVEESNYSKFLKQPVEAVEKIKDVEIFYSDSAQVKVRVSAPELLNYLDRKNRRKEFPNTILVDFFNSSGKVHSWLTAKSATRYDREKKIVVRDSVVLQNSDGRKLETFELTWMESDQEIVTDEYVKITQANGDILYGYGLKANQDFTNFEIRAPEGPVQLDGIEKDDF